MFIVWLLILIIVMFIMIRNSDNITGERVSVLGFSTKYFYMSNGESKNMYEQMRKDGIPDESLKEFIMMEDRFLKLESLSVCTQTSRIIEAFALSKEIKDNLVHIDILVNNAFSEKREDILKVTKQEWDSGLNTMLSHVFFCSQAVLPNMLERGSGSIINMSSFSFFKL
mgnify:CR=1 FL=1